MPTALRILVLEHKASDIFSSKIKYNSSNEEALIMLFQLANA